MSGGDSLGVLLLVLRRRVLLFLSVVLFAVSCFLDRHGRGDLHLYRWFGGWVMDGRVPYRDFFVEYPPGSMPAFLLPAAISRAHYALLFRLEMALCGAIAVVAIGSVLAVLRAGPRRSAFVLGLAGLSPLVVGPVFLYTYDAWPAMLVVAGLAALLHDRQRLAFALLGLAAAAKIYPLVLLLVAAVRIWRRDGARALVGPIVAAAATAAVVVLPFAAIAPGGVGFSLYVQAKRALQVESLGASLLLVADRLGIHTAHVAIGSPSSMIVVGRASTALGAVSSLLLVVTVLGAIALFARGRNDDERLVTASAAAVLGFVAFGKVFSPQYLTWLVFLVPLVGGPVGFAAGVLLVVACLVSRLWWRHAHEISDIGPLVWAILGRNLLVVALYGIVVWTLLRAGSRSRPPSPPSRSGSTSAA